MIASTIPQCSILFHIRRSQAKICGGFTNREWEWKARDRESKMSVTTAKDSGRKAKSEERFLADG